VHIKNRISRLIFDFLIIFSISFIFMYVFVLIFVDAWDSVPLRDINGIFVLSVFITLAGFIMESKSELSKKEMLVRHVIHMLVIVGVVISTAVFMDWISWHKPVLVVLFALAVMLVYIAVMVIDWYRSVGLADSLTQRLRERYKG